MQSTRTVRNVLPAPIALSLLAGLALTHLAAAQTITVTTLNDVSDASGLERVADLPGPDGRVSFREAVTAANNTPGPQTIAFAIPVSEFWLDTSVALLKLEENAFFVNDSSTTIDFSTQTTNIGDTNPNGPEVGIYGLQPNGSGIAAIFVNGNNCVIKGLGRIYLRGYGVQLVGDNNRVIGCQISGAFNAAVNIEGSGATIPTGNIVGGTAPGEGNSLSGLTIRPPADDNLVIGNTIIGGVSVQGAPQFGVSVHNNRIGGPTPAERNVIAGAGHYGEEGFPVGVQVLLVDADNTTIEGNYIGTTANGMQAYSPQIGPYGVEVRDSRGTTIRTNVIAGLRVVGTDHYAGQIFGEAIHIGAVNFNTSATTVQGNTIGLAADGITPIVTRAGIVVSPLTSIRHALGTLIASNHIASVETTGIFVAGQENGVTLTRNSIHDCAGLGIDLGTAAVANGPTPNDPGDGDTGANGLQNYPVITGASPNLATGTFSSVPSQAFQLEFFASPACDPTGFGEGRLYVGFIAITTNAAGETAFAAPLFPTAPQGWVLTATATRTSTGDTSEFSACSLVTGPAACSADFDCNGDVGTDADIEAFFACLAGTCPPPPCTSSADFNNDGDFGTDADIESFFRVLAGGPC